MPPYTDSLTEALRRYELWSDAEIKVAAGQAYSIGGRSLTRANEKEIQANLEYLDKRIPTGSSSLSMTASTRSRILTGSALS